MTAFWTIFLLAVCRPIATTKPHIVFVVLDDVGINDVGYNNPQEIHSPNIDAMANDGIILTNSYVHAVCTPSRAAFMTGYEPHRNGLQLNVILNYAPIGLPLEFDILPQHLKRQGYSTYMFGKWHLGACHPCYLPFNRGFDHFFGTYAAGTYHYEHDYPLSDDGKAKSVPDVPDVFDLFENSRPALEYNGTHTLEALLIETNKSLSTRDPNKPLFMYWASSAAHSPLQYSSEYDAQYSGVTNPFRKRHNAFVSYLDDAIGRLKQLLIVHGIYNNSYIICTTDNGGDTRSGGNNYPFRGGKRTNYEGGTKGVAFIHSPLLTNKGYKYDGFVHSTDYFAMIRHLAGAAPDPDIDGMNIWPAIVSNTSSPRTEFFYDLYPDILAAGLPSGSFRQKQWKLTIGNALLPKTIVTPADVTGEYADQCGGDLNRDPNPKQIQLYNIDDDPTESKDLSCNISYELKLAELKAKFTAKALQMVAPLFQPDQLLTYKLKTKNLTVLNTNWCLPILATTPPTFPLKILNNLQCLLP